MRKHIPMLASTAVLAVLVAVAAVGATAAPTKAKPPAKQLALLRQQIAALQAQNDALSPSGIAHQLAGAKAALDKYQSVDRAKADGYVVSSACEMLPGAGGMGIHYLSGAAVGDGKLDPARPEVLVYAPVGSALQLVAAEYFKPDADQDLSTDSDRPSLFGRAFDGPMLGHNATMPKHYDLHVWLWQRNPSGMFAQWNPDVSCA